MQDLIGALVAIGFFSIIVGPMIWMEYRFDKFEKQFREHEEATRHCVRRPYK